MAAIWGTAPAPGVTFATAKKGGSGTANLPPDVKARMDKIAGFNGQIGTVKGAPPKIGPPDRLGGPGFIGPPDRLGGPGFIGPPDRLGGPGFIGPPDSLGGPGFVGPPDRLGGVPPSMGGGYADVMRILMGGSNPNVTGQTQPYPSFGFPQFSNLLLNWGGRNG